MEKKNHTWKGKMNTYGGRLTLIKSSMSNVCLFLLSLFEMPKGPGKRFNFFHEETSVE